MGGICIFLVHICGEVIKKEGKNKRRKDEAEHRGRNNLSILSLTWKSCDGRIIAVSLNQVICGLGFPSTWHSKCNVEPSCACFGCSFCIKRGAAACSPDGGSAMIPGN